MKNFFRYNQKFDRQQFLIGYAIIMAIVMIAFGLICTPPMIFPQLSGPHVNLPNTTKIDIEKILMALSFLVGIMAFLFSISAFIFIQIRRLTDMGWRHWWLFGNLVPIFNLVLLFLCFIMPSKFQVEMVPEEVQNKSQQQVRPWARFFARCFDYILYGVLGGLLLGLVIGFIQSLGFNGFTNELLSSKLYLVAVLIVWYVLLEAVLLSTLGTTPGKWLFKIILRTHENNKLNTKQALVRSVRVCIQGCGCFIPILSLGANIIAYKTLVKNKITSWDEDYGYVIIHQKLSKIRTSIVIMVAVLMLFLLMIIQF